LVGQDVVLGADLGDRSEGGAGRTLLLEEGSGRQPDATSG
jgi:hypothetical protein